MPYCEDMAMVEPSSLHAQVVDAVDALDERAGPACVRDLLYAETVFHSALPSTVEMTSAVHRADGGIDGVTNFPFSIEAVGIPAGRLVWQVKTGSTKPSASAELGGKAKHHAVQQAIVAGADYVLVWTTDQPSETRLALQQSLSEEVTALRSGALAHVLVADDVAAWAWRHVQVLLELVPLEGLRPMDQLAGTEVENGTTDVEQRIRMYLTSPLGRALRIAGPTGSGKSTAIRLAASTLQDHLSILVARGMEGASINLLTRFAHRRIDVGVVIERCTPEQAAALEHLVADSHGHLRLVTEGVEPGWSHLQKTDVVEVRPMMANMDRRLLAALRVPGPLQSELMGSTGGNPMLLSSLGRGEQELSSDVFRRLTDDLDIRALASFALMPPFGAHQLNLGPIASVSGVTIETLEDTAAGLADRQLIPWAAFPSLPAAIASAALRNILQTRRSWLDRLLTRLPDDFVPAALGQLATVGRAAEPLVIDLLERTDALPVEPSEESQAYELLDRLILVTEAVPAAPTAAAQRLKELVRRYPWAGQLDLSHLAAMTFIRAAECLDQALEAEAAGPLLLLDVFAASGIHGGPLRTSLRSMLSINRTTEGPRQESVRRYAQELGGSALEEFLATDDL
jgi:hypothetical protein